MPNFFTAVLTALILLSGFMIPGIISTIKKAYKKYKLRNMQNLLTPYGTISDEEIFKQILYLHYNNHLKWSPGEIYRYCHNNYTATYKNLNIDIYHYAKYENEVDSFELKLHSTEDFLDSHDINIKIPRINVNDALHEAASLLYQNIESRIKGNSNNTITDTVKSNEQLEQYYNVLKYLVK